MNYQVSLPLYQKRISYIYVLGIGEIWKILLVVA